MRMRLKDLILTLIGSAMILIVLFFLFSTMNLKVIAVFSMFLSLVCAGAAASLLSYWLIFRPLRNKAKDVAEKRKKAYHAPKIDNESYKEESPIDLLTEPADNGDLTAQSLIETYARLEVIADRHDRSVDALRAKYSVKFTAMRKLLDAQKDIAVNGKRNDLNRINDFVNKSAVSLDKEMASDLESINEQAISEVKADADYLTGGGLHAEQQSQ